MARPTNVDRLPHIFKSVRCYGFFFFYLCSSSFCRLIAYSRPMYKNGICLHIVVRNAHALSLKASAVKMWPKSHPFWKWYDGGAFKGMYTHTYLLIVDDGHLFHTLHQLPGALDAVQPILFRYHYRYHCRHLSTYVSIFPTSRHTHARTHVDAQFFPFSLSWGRKMWFCSIKKK